MAGGWTRDGAVRDQIDDTVADAVLATRASMPKDESEAFCAICGEDIPDVFVVGGWSDRSTSQIANSVDFTMFVDKVDHRLNERSSSAWARYADALRRISLACHSSRTSRSSAFTLSATSAGTPARLPLLPLTFFSHSCSV